MMYLLTLIEFSSRRRHILPPPAFVRQEAPGPMPCQRHSCANQGLASLERDREERYNIILELF